MTQNREKAVFFSSFQQLPCLNVERLFLSWLGGLQPGLVRCSWNCRKPEVCHARCEGPTPPLKPPVANLEYVQRPHFFTMIIDCEFKSVTRPGRWNAEKFIIIKSVWIQPCNVTMVVAISVFLYAQNTRNLVLPSPADWCGQQCCLLVPWFSWSDMAEKNLA